MVYNYTIAKSKYQYFLRKMIKSVDKHYQVVYNTPVKTKLRWVEATLS